MKFAAFFSFSRILTGVLFFLLFSSLTPLLKSAPPQPKSKDSLSQTKSLAESQHEIVMLLLKNKEYEKAVAESNKIFDMSWPESQEPLLLKELLFLSDCFLREGQVQLGLQMIETNSRHFKRNASQIEILKEQGYIYKNLHQNDKALECFRKAQALEHKN
jgi:tetratricopeptide (TPR) repeat protein